MIGVDRGTDFKPLHRLRCVPDAQEFISEWLGTTSYSGLGVDQHHQQLAGSHEVRDRHNLHRPRSVPHWQQPADRGLHAYAMETFGSLSRHCPRCPRNTSSAGGLPTTSPAQPPPTRAVQVPLRPPGQGVPTGRLALDQEAWETVTDTGVAVTAGFTQAGQKPALPSVTLTEAKSASTSPNSLVATHTTNINTASRMGTIGQNGSRAPARLEVGTGWDWGEVLLEHR